MTNIFKKSKTRISGPYTLLSSIVVLLGCMGTIGSHYALSQMGSGNGGAGFVSHNILGGDFTIQIPQNWFEHDYTGATGTGIVKFCDTPNPDCSNFNMVSITEINPIPGTFFSSVDDPPEKIFNGLIQSERLLGLDITSAQFGNSHEQQNIEFTTYDPSGVQLAGNGYHIVRDGHLFVIYFESPRQSWNTIVPIYREIYSKMGTVEHNGGGNSIEALAVEAQGIHDTHCANMAIISSMDVNKPYEEYEHYDPVCHTWR